MLEELNAGVQTIRYQLSTLMTTNGQAPFVTIYLEIEEGKQIEYQGYIYVIYSLVRSNTDKPGTVLLSILENTDMLITGLKNLNSGIKRYIDETIR